MSGAPAGAERWLALAAAPTFAAMAFVTALQGRGGAAIDALCSAQAHASPWTGMVPMYLLMSAFHSAPWWRRWRLARG